MLADAAPAAPRDRPRLLVALFAVYLALLVWTVLWKLEVPYISEVALLGRPRPWKLVPFVASGDDGGSAPLEVLANVALFVPFGLYLGLLAPRRPAWRSGLVVAGASLVLEVTQHLLAVGSFDSTDVITNTAGGLLGLGVLALLRRRGGSGLRPAIIRTCLVGTVVAVVAVGAFVASPIHFVHRQDVIVQRR